MPTRLIREGINDSKAVNELTEGAELFYRRLLMVVDDYGRFESETALLRVKLFAFKLDAWPEERITKALQECAQVHNDDGEPLVLLYSVGKKRYLQVSKFGQRIRHSKYPGPGEPPPDPANKHKKKADPSKNEPNNDRQHRTDHTQGEPSQKKPEPSQPKEQSSHGLTIVAPQDTEARIRSLAAKAPDQQDSESGVHLAISYVTASDDPALTLKVMEGTIPLWFDAMREGRARMKTMRFLLMDQDYKHRPRDQRKALDRDQTRRSEGILVTKALRKMK